MRNLLRLTIIAVLAVYSCSDDEPATTPSGTVLYSKDSISVWLTLGGSFGSDSIAFSTNETGGNGVKIEFQIQSNADSIHASGYYNFYTNATPPVPILTNIHTPIDEPFLTNLNFASGSTYFGFVVKLTTYSITEPYYVRLKNIKITKL